MGFSCWRFDEVRKTRLWVTEKDTLVSISQYNPKHSQGTTDCSNNQKHCDQDAAEVAARVVKIGFFPALR